jgi:DNA-directed RNA polymerase specialized sigma24 family protein
MPVDPKRKALAEAQRAQTEFERAKAQSEKASKKRRQSFARAKAAGLSLAEIGEAVSLHRSRVDQILRGQ